MNNMIPQLVCDIESAICNCTFSMLANQCDICTSPAFLKKGLDNDDCLLLLPPILESSPKK